MVGLRKYFALCWQDELDIRERGINNAIRFWALIAEKIGLPFTEVVEEQTVGFEWVNLKCLLDIQVEILSSVGI